MTLCPMASKDASGVASSICLAKQADLEAAYGLGFRVQGISGLTVWGSTVDLNHEFPSNSSGPDAR